jgi:hypothetical protein
MRAALASRGGVPRWTRALTVRLDDIRLPSAVLGELEWSEGVSGAARRRVDRTAIHRDGAGVITHAVADNDHEVAVIAPGPSRCGHVPHAALRRDMTVIYVMCWDPTKG